MAAIQKTKASLLSRNRGRIIFLLCIAVFVFWNLPLLVNIYSIAVVGAVFEVLWVPMTVAVFALPAVSMTAWIHRKYAIQSIHFYSLLLSFINITVLFYRTVKDV